VHKGKAKPPAEKEKPKKHHDIPKPVAEVIPIEDVPMDKKP